MNIIECTNAANTTESKNRKIKYIVIHYTAGVTSRPGTAKSNARYFAKETTKASADFIIDDENVVRYNPDIKNRYCWHCGGSKYKTKGGSLYKICTSANSIGIEMCSTNSAKKVTNPNDGNWYFTDAVVNNCVELTKKLMDEYGIDIDHVIRHYDVNGKPCPGVVGWNEDTNDILAWLSFKTRLVEKEFEELIEGTAEKVKQVTDTKIDTLVSEIRLDNKDTEEPEVKGIKNSENLTKTPADTKRKQGIFDLILSFLTGLFKK